MTESSKPTEAGNSDRRSMRGVASTFSGSINAVRVFAEQIAPLADEHDRAALDALTESLKGLLGRDVEVYVGNPFPRSEVDSNPEAETAAASEGTAVAADEEHAAPVPVANTLPGPPESDGVGPEATDDGRPPELPAEVRRALLAQVNAFLKASPVQGQLLRRGALTALFSAYELLVAELLHVYYIRYPAALPSTDRSITLDELREIGSIEEAEGFIVSKEVDSVLRDSVEAQLTYFVKRLKVDLSPLDDIRPRLVELAQRRNLIIHNGGIVNKTYLAKVPEAKGIAEGDRLEVGEEYLTDAIDLVLAIGAVLVQLCWRKWDSDEGEQADSWAINACFDALVEQRHHLAIRLCEFFEHSGLASDASRRVVVVNQAIAHRELGENDEVQRLVSALDWSACSSRFRLALHTLRRDDDEFFALAHRAIAAGEISREELENWPLFAPLRRLQRWAVEFPGTSDRPDVPDAREADTL